MKKIILKHWALITLLLSLSLMVWPLVLPGYFSHHDDLQVMRIFEMRRCWQDLQIPCRWVPDMGYGNGFPLFNYYSAFPYYIGSLFSFAVGYIGAAKLLFFIPFVLGALAMYFLGRELFGHVGGFTAGILYSFAPYHALDGYVRGAVAESFGIALIPLVFYFSLKLIRQNNIFQLLGLSLSLAAFLTSHNIMTLFFIPILLLWILYWLVIEKFHHLLPLIFSLVLGLGLAAFFIIPAYGEKSLVRTDTLTRMDLNYRAHFATVKQLLFTRFWGYGSSTPGPNDTISFQVGWPHWWLAIVAVITAFIVFLSKKISPSVAKNLKVIPKKEIILIGFLFMIFSGSLFMMHNKSAFIWEKFSILSYAQFPWRFLSVTAFSISLLGAFLVSVFKNRGQLGVVIVVCGLTIGLNWSFFRPEKFDFSLTDQQKLSGVLWEEQSKAAVLDYLPVTAAEPKEPAPEKPLVRSGQAVVSNLNNYSNSWQFKVQVLKPSVIDVPVFDFPGWQVKVNGIASSHLSENYMGRISFQLDPGNYEVVGNFTNTPIRSLSNIISLLSILIVLILLSYGKIKKINI